jgi:hypothetical protein
MEYTKPKWCVCGEHVSLSDCELCVCARVRVWLCAAGSFLFWGSGGLLILEIRVQTRVLNARVRCLIFDFERCLESSTHLLMWHFVLGLPCKNPDTRLRAVLSLLRLSLSSACRDAMYFSFQGWSRYICTRGRTTHVIEFSEKPITSPLTIYVCFWHRPWKCAALAQVPWPTFPATPKEN